MCFVQCLTGTEIGDFPKSGFEHLRGWYFQKIWFPNLVTISNTFPDLNHRRATLPEVPDIGTNKLLSTSFTFSDR